MSLLTQLQKLASQTAHPCVTISLNTHRTHPDNVQDGILLKNLLSEAETRVIAEYGKRPVMDLIAKINGIADAIDINYSLDSLHIFLSNDITEILRSPWPTTQQGVHISETFASRPLIKAFNRAQEYLVMILSQSGIQLYEAVNDGILGEIKNGDFPFAENPHYITHADKASDSKLIDNLLREFLNKVDKALIKVHQETGLHCVVVSTEENFLKLMQVADKPGAYYGLQPINYNDVKPVHVVKNTWNIVKGHQHAARTAAIGEMKEAVAQGKVLTDLQEIYQASIDGRAELLIVHQDFKQAVMMNGDRTFDLIEDPNQHNAIDDITSNIAWEVISKKGKVFFTSQDEIKDLGAIVLKVRY
jgi:Bacterial archaeo-eukaryotic release factor family 3